MTKPELCAAFYTIAGDTVVGAPFPPSPHSFRELCEATGAAGYVGMGLNFTDYVKARDAGLSPKDMRSILADNGLKYLEMEFLSDWFAPGDAGTRSRQAEEVFYRAADEVGVRFVKTGGDFSGKIWPLPHMIEAFKGLCRRAAQHGTSIALEPSPFTGVRDVPTARGIVEGADEANGGLLLDIWHISRCGIPFEAMATIPPEKVIAVEIDDALAEPLGDLWTDTIDNRLLPGDGALDIVGFLRTLDRMGVDRPISVEVLNKEMRKRPIAEIAKLTFDKSMAAIARARGAA